MRGGHWWHGEEISEDILRQLGRDEFPLLPSESEIHDEALASSTEVKTGLIQGM